MQFDAYQFESHKGCRLLFSTVADGSGANGPFREGLIEELSPKREYVCLAVDEGRLIRKWFTVSGLEVLDIWEKPKAE